MMGPDKGVVARIKRVSPECVSLHCIIHREALVAKKSETKPNKDKPLQVVLHGAVKLINTVQKSGKLKKTMTQ